MSKCIQGNSQDCIVFYSLFKARTLSQQSEPVSQIRVATKINSYPKGCAKENQDKSRDQAWVQENTLTMRFSYMLFRLSVGLVIPCGLPPSVSVSFMGFLE